jgi:redox-sensitive bicupin YhaK (pirin superfamily)
MSFLNSVCSTTAPKLRQVSPKGCIQGNNIVGIAKSAAEQASTIAEAVTAAIHRNSSAKCGILMIDGDGHPKVHGSGNFVGNAKLLEDILDQKDEFEDCQG